MEYISLKLETLAKHGIPECTIETLLPVIIISHAVHIGKGFRGTAEKSRGEI